MEPSDYKPLDPKVHDYLDGRLSSEDEQAFEARLARDSELKREVDEVRRALELLRTMPVQEPGAGFAERVIGRVREEELATRARKRILPARVPLWQHVVQVGLGAAAAALVISFIGMPGLFGDKPEDMGGSGEGSPVSEVAPTEDDLLPALADQNARFESMRRNVAHTQLADPDLQREVVALELRYSDLMRRNHWLAEQVSEMPGSRRAAYQEYLAALDEALKQVNDELEASQQERRAPDMAAINAGLAGVRAPDGLGDYELVANTGSLLPRAGIMHIEETDPGEIELYSLIRQADFRHDHEAVVDAADLYLRHFSDGLFRDNANAAAVAGQLRLGDDKAAAVRFAAKFGDYDEDLKPGQLELVRGLLTEAEFERLNRARKALR